MVADEGDYDPAADELPRSERFALDGRWVIVRADAVVAPGELVGKLAEQLGWVVDHRSMLALGYLLVGLDGRADALLRQPLPSSPNTSSALPLVAYVARHGKWSLLDAFVRDGWIRGSGGDAWEVMPILARYADAARVAEYAAFFSEDYDVEEYVDAETNPPPPSPSAGDIAELRAAYAGIMRQPTRRRADSADDVLESAVAVGHWSAAIALLEFLDGTDMNGRGQAAAKLTWRALAGLDIPVW